MQAHAALKAVDQDTGNMPAFIRPAGLLLDDRGKDHRFRRRGQRQPPGPTGPQFGDSGLHGLHHAFDELLARRAALEVIGFGQQRALPGRGGDRSLEGRVGFDDGKRRGSAQSFGKREGMDHGVATDQPRDDAAKSLTGPEGILAGLQEVGIAARKRVQPEERGAVNDVAGVESLCDLGRAGSFRDDQGGRSLQGAVPLQCRLEPQEMRSPGR